uniref:Uncharacterized protein n=1 Tax=Triticum urartu TaxID=4572 RepID=A0A8R7P1A7_TRIUA
MYPMDAARGDGTRLIQDEIDGPPGLHVVVLQPQERLQPGHALPQALRAAGSCDRKGRRRCRTLLGSDPPTLLGRPRPLHGRGRLWRAHRGREVELGLRPADIARRDVVGARGLLRGGVGAQPDARALRGVPDLRSPAAPWPAPDPTVRRLPPRRQRFLLHLPTLQRETQTKSTEQISMQAHCQSEIWKTLATLQNVLSIMSASSIYRRGWSRGRRRRSHPGGGPRPGRSRR